MKKITWALFLVLFVFRTAKAQDDELKPVTGTVAMTNVTIIPRPGQLIENSTVLVKDGLIAAVGKDVTIPPGARIVKADSLYLYSGFILGMSHAGIKMPENKEENSKVKDPGNPPNELAGITPERMAYQFLDPTDKSIENWREAGFTIAQTAPKGGMLPGTASVVLLKGNDNGMILKRGTALYGTFDGARRMYPGTILGVMAEYRNLFRRAEQALEYTASYEKDPSGRQRLAQDVVLEAFYPVVQEQIPLTIQAEEMLEAQRAMLLKKELDFDLVISELKQGWDLIQDIKNSGTAVQFSLDLPEWKEDKKKKDSTETKEVSEEKNNLEARKKDFLKKYYGQMAQYEAAGVPFSFSGLGVKPGDVQKNLQKIVEQGLSADAALAALTTTPASMLGVEKMAGSVEKGKMANLMISNKPFFEKDAKIKYVMVEGELFEYDLKETKKADPATLDAISGEWTYESNTPGGPMTGVLTLKKEESGEISGTMTNSLTSEESTLNDVVLSDKKLSFNFSVVFQGQPLTVEALLSFSEDTFEGTLTGGGESFPIEGSKNPEL